MCVEKVQLDTKVFRVLFALLILELVQPPAVNAEKSTFHKRRIDPEVENSLLRAATGRAQTQKSSNTQQTDRVR